MFPKRIQRYWNERGDTLIEVTFALAILGFVLMGSTVIATTAFRMGQTARERTQMASDAQDQMEALRSFRDNHTWAEFRNGNGSGVCSGTNYCGIDNVLTTNCTIDSVTGRCFHMERRTIGARTEWVPMPGAISGSVPTSTMALTTGTAGGVRQCGFDFVMRYTFTPLGGGVTARNKISTRLVNLNYAPGTGGPACP